MSRFGMTGLTQKRPPLNQHAGVVRSVNVMTQRAIFAHGCVLPQMRSAHLRMALIASLVEGGAGE